MRDATARAAYRRKLGLLLLLLVPLGLATKLPPSPGWIHNHAGGVAYVCFWSLLLLWARPSLAPGLAAALVLAATCALEILQLWNPPLLAALRINWLGRTLLGQTFSWGDFPPYLLGAGLAWGLARGARGGTRPPGAAAPGEAPTRFRVHGRIEERETGRPLAGLIVRAYDKDLVLDDTLGFATSDADGAFEIRFRREDFRDLFESLPDLYLRVYDTTGTRLLHETSDAIRHGASSDESYRIVISARDLVPR